MLDLRTKSDQTTEILIDKNRIWINVNGECVCRIQAHGPIVMDADVVRFAKDVVRKYDAETLAKGDSISIENLRGAVNEVQYDA